MFGRNSFLLLLVVAGRLKYLYSYLQCEMKFNIEVSNWKKRQFYWIFFLRFCCAPQMLGDFIFFPSIKNEYFLWIAARYFSVLFYDVYLFYGRTGDMKRPGGTPFGCDRSIWHVICYIVMKGNNEGFLFLRHNRVSSTTTVSHIFQFNIVHWFRYSFRRRICRTTLYES